MLKKCLKHEWKACWKNMALLNGAAIFMGALGGFGFLFSQLSELPDLLIVLYLFEVKYRIADGRSKKAKEARTESAFKMLHAPKTSILERI